MSLFGWIFVVKFKYKKQGDHWDKKFFINKSVKAWISLKEGHQGLLKLHVPLRGCSSMGEMELQKGDFVWSRKMCEEACQDLLKYCVSFGGGLEFFYGKNGKATERQRSIVKCGEIPFQGWACENPVKLSMCDGPIETIEYIWWRFGGCMIALCHKTAEIHFLCIQLIN